MSVRVEYVFDPFELVGIPREELPEQVVANLMDDIAVYVHEQTLVDIGEQISPLTGRPFAELSDEYAHHKQEEGAPPIPNLELTGAMLDSYQVTRKDASHLVATVGDDQMDKADGHCNFSGQSKFKRPRQFIPDVARKQSYRSDIIEGITAMITDALDESHV